LPEASLQAVWLKHPCQKNQAKSGKLQAVFASVWSGVMALTPAAPKQISHHPTFCIFQFVASFNTAISCAFPQN
jgi:hypothetical protein